jgi:hypothetical protein
MSESLTQFLVIESCDRRSGGDMNQAVIGIVPTVVQANAIVEELRTRGFKNTDISVAMPDEASFRDFGHEKHTKAPEGTTAGASTGFVLGGALGWLAGAGTLAVPMLGSLLVAGPIVAALSGAAVGGGIGGLVGALIGMGIPEIEAKQYEGKLKDGNVLISVHTESNDAVKFAEEVFRMVGGKDVYRTGEAPVARARRSLK